MQLELNFFELIEQNFDMNVFIKKFEGKKLFVESTVQKIPILDDKVTWEKFEILTYASEGFESKVIDSQLNSYITVWYLSRLIFSACPELFQRYNIFSRSALKFYISVEHYDEGIREIVLQPYYFHEYKKIGFLIDFHFNQKIQDYTKKCQQLSFSLDKQGRANTLQNKEIRDFLSRSFNEYVEPIFKKLSMHVYVKLYNIDFFKLPENFYMGAKNKDTNAFSAIKKYDVFKIAQNRKIIFLFPQAQQQFAREIYSGLSGKSYPTQFAGMEKFFNLKFDNTNVVSELINGFTEKDIQGIESFISNINTPTTLIFCLANQESGFAKEFYIRVKVACLKNNIVSQFLYQAKFLNSEKLKWSVSNIGLQIFCKMGGVPWRIEDGTRNSKIHNLILGVGTSHSIDANGNINKYFAYAICTDSSGVFKFALPLAFSEDINSYYSAIKNGLISIKEKLQEEDFNFITVHMSEKIKIKEAGKLENFIKEVFENQTQGLAILKINRHHNYWGFSEKPHRVINKGVYAKISKSEYLLWVDGVLNGGEIKKRYPRPILIEVRYISNIKDDVDVFLNDIFKLSAANWRGFNAEATPITLVYSKLISYFISNIYESELDVELNSVEFKHSQLPWFL